VIQILLQRKESNKDGLFGVLFYNGIEVVTLERSLTSKVKPVEPGVYKLVPHDGAKWKHKVALVNEDLGVYHWPDVKAKRSAILIHSANLSSQLKGCIALGQGKVMMWDQILQRTCQAITKSIPTCNAFMAWYSSVRELHNGDIYLEIKNPP